MTESESTGGTGSAAPKTDVVAEFKGQPAAEKLLALAAAVTLIAFIVKGNWNFLFKYSWFPTCAFLASVAVLVLIALDLFKIKVMDAKIRTYVICVLAIVPAAGFVIDALSNFWHAVMLAGAIAMGFAGVKITSREQLIKKG